MATNTTNYNLVKPSENEYYDININNSNLDIIDTEIKKINDKLSSVSTNAQSTSFDNSDNGMIATNVQEAIEENKTSILNLNQNISNINQEINGQRLKAIQINNELEDIL